MQDLSGLRTILSPLYNAVVSEQTDDVSSRINSLDGDCFVYRDVKKD